MAIIGAGTCKTTVAKILSSFLYQNSYTKVNANELLGKYLGQTAPIVRELFKQASAGVLFIDEAYSLQRSAGGKSGSYGIEAII